MFSKIYDWFLSNRTDKLKLGICAMDKKSRSKPMREILSRFPEDIFQIVIFGDNTILNEPIESWPKVDALISFFSNGFPTEKAIQYIKLRNPFCVNNLEMESELEDRRKVYRRLQSLGIDVPTHVFVDWTDPTTVVEEFDEYIIANGVQINKPLVEKPVDAENHNIHIYYPVSAGGGSKHLFRKKNDRSSEFFSRECDLRKDGAYIYEEFLITQGTDVKVYTVGPEYAHAEARKSPVVDGRVNRDAAGLEVRYPVILSPWEKEMAAKIVNSFRQHVCGFDILRVPGKSFCCDVNGFSFVKNSPKYYHDASQILMELMLQSLRPELKVKLSTSTPMIVRNKMTPRPKGIGQAVGNPSIALSSSTSSMSSISTLENSNHGREKSSEELRCVIAIIRHADRTPKQKMKIKVSDPKFLAYFHQFSKSPQSDLKVKSKSALMRFLDITREFISESCVQTKMSQVDLYRKLRQIRDVLERWEISGINRKLQMKPTKWEEEPSSPPESDELSTEKITKKKGGLATEVQLIIKWGGDLTLLGRQQAEQAGARFRHEMYPDNEGGGVLRLHSTYRHDLKIKSSDEGRCMKTAAAFAKGLLELEGPLTPILASLVTVEENGKQMLDRAGNDEIRADMVHCKDHLTLIQEERENDLTEEEILRIAPNGPESVREALRLMRNPRNVLKEMHSLMAQLCETINELKCIHEVGLDRAEASAAESSAVAQVAHQVDDSSALTSSPVNSKPPTPSNSSNNLASLSLDQPNATQGHIEIGVPNPTSPHPELSLYPSSLPSLSGSPPPLTPTAPLASLQSSKSAPSTSSPPKLYLNETFELMLDRWRKLHSDFFSSKTDKFDLSKVPDVYDMVRYDCLHNSHVNLPPLLPLLIHSSHFENAVVPQEYGIDREDKRVIGSKMCHALLEKVKLDLSVAHSNRPSDLPFHLDHSHAEDLNINSLGRVVRTRLYFTSESHLHTFLNVFRYPSPSQPCIFPPATLALLDQMPELSYLTQIVIRLFQGREEPFRYRCELSLSVGAVNKVVNGEFYSSAYQKHVLNGPSFTPSSPAVPSTPSSPSKNPPLAPAPERETLTAKNELDGPKEIEKEETEVETLSPSPSPSPSPAPTPKKEKKVDDDEEDERTGDGEITHSVKMMLRLNDDGSPYLSSPIKGIVPVPTPPPSPTPSLNTTTPTLFPPPPLPLGQGLGLGWGQGAGMEVAPFVGLNKSLSFEEVMRCIDDALAAAAGPSSRAPSPTLQFTTSD